MLSNENTAVACDANMGFQETTAAEVLEKLLTEQWVGTLSPESSDIRIHVQEGRIAAVRGHKQLGDVAVELGYLTPRQLQQALQAGGQLGRTLLHSNLLKPHQLQHCLYQQAREALAFLRTLPPTKYIFAPDDRLPLPIAGLTLKDIKIVEPSEATLPYGMIYRLGACSTSIYLSPEAWELARWLNGRRTIARALQISRLGKAEGEKAAGELLNAGVLEPSAIAGFKTLVIRLKPFSEARQMPASIHANLFLRHMQGEKTVQEIVDRLNYPLEEAALLVTNLHRDGITEVVSGHEAMRRLLEEF